MSRKKSRQNVNQPLTTHATMGYRPPAPVWSSLLDRTRLPVFDYNWAEAMELTSQVRFGVAVGNGPLYQSEIEVQCDNQEVIDFVQEQWKRLWTSAARRILSHKRAGYGGLEIVYDYSDEKQQLEIKSVYDFHPLDVKPLTSNGEVCGIQVTGRNLKEPVQLIGPRSVWLKYNAEYGNLYGRSLYRGAFEPWWEKYGPQGATDLRRLKYRKDSWIGDIIYYPTRLERIQLPNGQTEEVSGHDLAVQMVSQRAAGGILALPSNRNENGERDYEYVPPTSIAGGADILAYVDSLDWEIWKGLLIPREVVEAAASGSGFSGRSVPMLAFLSMRDAELQDIVAAFNHVFEFMVEFKWPGTSFTINPRPLSEQFAENAGGTQVAGAIGGTNNAGPMDIFGNRQNEFQFGMDEPAGSKWITIGGKSNEDGERSGGFPVLIDKNGNIIKGGPKGLRGKNVKDVKRHFDEAKEDKENENSVKRVAKEDDSKQPSKEPSKEITTWDKIQKKSIEYADAYAKQIGLKSGVSVQVMKGGAAAGHVSMVYNKDTGRHVPANTIQLRDHQLSEKFVQDVLRHEATHVKQGEDGRLYIAKNEDGYNAIYWEGKEYMTVKEYRKITSRIKGNYTEKSKQKAYEQYRSFPWEVEAHNAGDPYRDE